MTPTPHSARKNAAAEPDLTVSLPPSSQKKERNTARSQGKAKSGATPTNPVYEVEKVLDRRVIGNSVQYLLKWEGYTHASNTWEFEADMECTQLIDDYLKATGHLDEVSYKEGDEDEVLDDGADDEDEDVRM